MKTNIIRNLALLLLILSSLAQISCVPEEEELIPPRIFRPVAQVDNSIEREIITYFKSIEGADLYTGDISLDSLFTEIQESITISPDTADIYYDNTKYTHIRFTDLMAAQKYFIRLKAIHADPGMNSGYYEMSATTRSLFIPPSPNEILDVAFICKWFGAGEPLSKIRIYDANGENVIAQLRVSGNDNNNGWKLVEGLEGNTTYWVYLYSGDVIRGRGLITTQPTIEGENIVDLTQIINSEVLQDTIPNVPDGSVILLKRGFTYVFTSSPQINGSLTIRSGYDFIPDLAVIKLDGNSFDIPPMADFDEIVLKDLSLKSTWEGSSYLFFLDSCNINRIEIDNIRSYGHRGFFRATSAEFVNTSVNTLLINNCVIDTCREYGIVHQSGPLTSIQDIQIRNSTFNYVVRPFFCSWPSSVSESNTITLENCTFYNMPADGRTFFDYEVGSQVTIRNCIFGKNVNIWDQSGIPQGYRLNRLDLNGNIVEKIPISFSYINSYMTSDFKQDDSHWNYSNLDLTPYNVSVSDLFTDPENGNFGLKDGGFPGRFSAGDPRWW